MKKRTKVLTVRILTAVLTAAGWCSFHTCAKQNNTGTETEQLQPEAAKAGESGNSLSCETSDGSGIVCCPPESTGPDKSKGQEKPGEGSNNAADGGQKLKETQSGEENTDREETEQEETEQEEIGDKEDNIIFVRVESIHVCLPEGGRIYDGTDQIEVGFETKTEGKGELPEYGLECEAHLEHPDAGIQKVFYEVRLATEEPERIRIAEDQIWPELNCEVQKRPLSLYISDAEKYYGEKADAASLIWKEEMPVRAEGFLTDETGNTLIPEGFLLPEPEIDDELVSRWSPMYEKGQQKRFESALKVKLRENGDPTGEPTANYRFCFEENDPSFHPGTLIISGNEIRKGREYRLSGEEGAYAEKPDGTIIIRAGTDIIALPCKGGGYSETEKKKYVTSDGIFRFSMHSLDEDGNVCAESKPAEEAYLTDGCVPQAQVTVLGTQSTQDGTLIGKQADLSMEVPCDGCSGLKSVRCRWLVGKTGEEMPIAGEWREVPLSGEGTAAAFFRITEEGVYLLETQAVDKVGNVSLSRSLPVMIDRTPPVLQVEGVKDQSSNMQEPKIRITCTDPNLLHGSLQAELHAVFGGKNLSPETGPETIDSEILTYDDFGQTRAADGVYTLHVQGSDQAGNLSVQTLSFSVNRFGSAYSLGTGTAEELKEYFHKKPFPVSFTETNVDEVGNARILIRRDDKVAELRSGPGFHVTETQNKEGKRTYVYQVPASAFQKDGFYEILLMTQDRAGNASDSAASALPVRFAVDRTPPECRIYKTRKDGIYPSGPVTVTAEIRDNLALSGVQVYLNSQSESYYTQNQIQELGGILKIELESREEWQHLQIYAADMAGNETWTKESIFYISSKSKPEQILPYREGEGNIEPDQNEMQPAKIPLENMENKARHTQLEKELRKKQGNHGWTRYLSALLLLAGLSVWLGKPHNS